jgi:hypothetical protein
MTEPKIYAPSKQDLFLSIVLFKEFKNGFFVDIGAGNGYQFNQTLHFEETSQWTGINVEPDPKSFQELIQTRPKCINLNQKPSNLGKLFTEQNVKHIHYLTIDWEEDARPLIESIDFSKVYIDVIRFENKYDSYNPIVKFLGKQGYQVVQNNFGGKFMSDITMVQAKSQFIQSPPS